MQHVQHEPIFAGGIYEYPKRRSAQVGTMANVRAAVFVIWIKAEFHRHPSLNAEKLKQKSKASNIKCFPPKNSLLKPFGN
jgi:hypothetical protein